jgi:ABC-2 type transport system permease protein
MIIRLARAEVDRLFSRRFTKIALVVVLLVIAVSQVGAYFEMQPPSQAEVAEATRYYEEQHRDWAANHEQYEQECVAAGNTPENCVYAEPKLSDFLFVQSFEDVARGAVQIAIYLVALTALMIGGSFIGAEFSSGSIANWLSFIPQRGQVYASKLITVAAFSAVLSAVAAALTIGAVVGVARWLDVPVVKLPSLFATAGRGILVAVALAVIGFCLGLLGRHTAAAIGTLLGYLFVWFVRNGIFSDAGWAARLTPWTPEGNLSAIVTKKHLYYIPTERVTAEGSEMDYVERSVGLAHGLTYWGILLAVIIVATALVFRRRDVS